VSVLPADATVEVDEAMSFVATYRHTASYLQLKRNDLIVSTAMNTGMQGCWVFYRRDLNRLYLRDDSGAYLDAGAPGTGTTVENSRCRLMAGSSSVSGSGTDLEVTYRLSFKPAFAGSYQLILRNEEMNTGEWSAYTDHGDLTVSGDGTPSTIGVSPSSATVDADVATSFVATYRHTASYLQLKRNDLIVSTAMNTGMQGCWVFYRRDLNRLYLRDDSGAYLDAGAPGTGTTVENSRCRLMAGSSSVSGSGPDLEVTYRLSFKPAFAGSYQLILRSEEMNTGEWSAYTDHGDLSVEVDGTPSTVSVLPADATVEVDEPMNFVATYRHTASYLQLKRNDLIVSTAMNTGLQGCWVFYRRDLNRLYLRDDSGAYLDAGAPGTGTTVENTRCRLMAGSSSVSGSGTDLEVTYRLSFKPAFAGSYQLILRNEEMNTGEWSAYTDHGDLIVE
jgi:hypothetical protein